MKKNAFFKKALTFISAAVMAGAIGLGAGIGSKVSADTTGDSGSSSSSSDNGASDTTTIILTKYAVAKDTGLNTQKDLTTEPDSSKDRVQGAVFTLYDVTDQYWKDVAPTLTGKGTAEDTTDADSLTANEHKYDLNTATKIDPETGSAVTEATKTDTAKTDANGQITYKDLPNYNAAGQYKVYLFHEESAPTGYTLSPDFVVSLPVKGADGTAYVYPKDEVTGAYQLKFTKIDANSETKLEGAVFYIKNGDQYAQVNGQYGEDNQVVGFDKNPATVKWVNTEAEATQFKSKADGSFGFSATTQTIKNGETYGLAEGTKYTIEEKTAPNGYKIDPEIKGYSDLSVTVATEDENGNAGDGYTVTDTPEGILPHTGGAGIIAIVVAGLAIVTVGVIAYNRRRANA